MSSWQERVDSQTDPQVLLEHVARYRLAVPLLRAAGVWVDLGCGSGLPAEVALGGQEPPPRLLLVDRDADALRVAEQRFARASVECAVADLGDERDLAQLDGRIRALAGDGDACVTCFEVVEHLDDFVPLLGMLTALVSEISMTVVLSVPNDAFWALHNPHHRTMWGGDAFEEFRSLLPGEATVVHQLAVHGSVLEPLVERAALTHSAELRVRADAIPTHYLIAFGARHASVEPVVGVEQLDLQERRAWEWQREADLAWMQVRDRQQQKDIAWLRQREEDLEYKVAQLREQLEQARAPDAAGER